MNRRIIKLKTLRNLRTLAGLQGIGGKKIRKNILLRSAMVNVLSPEDAEVLTNRYALKKIVDLRTEFEKEKNPDQIPADVSYCYIPVARERIPGVSREAVPGQNMTPEMMPDLRDMYAELVSNPDCVEQFSQILKEIMCNRDGAVLWHCTAGKDRCGLVALFLEYMLGVSREDILEDYLLTNRDSLKDARKYYILIRLFKKDKILAKRVYDAYIASPQYLKAAFEEIENQYGSLDRFLEQGLHITREEIEDFRNYALE